MPSAYGASPSSRGFAQGPHWARPPDPHSCPLTLNDLSPPTHVLDGTWAYLMCRTYDDNSGGVGVGRSVQRRAEPLLGLVLHLYHVHTVPLSVVAWSHTQSHTGTETLEVLRRRAIHLLTYLLTGRYKTPRRHWDTVRQKGVTILLPFTVLFMKQFA